MSSLFKVKPKFTEIDPYRIFYNVGCLLDIPTGSYINGLKGEKFLNGGLGVLTGVVGRANTFKSTFSHFLMLSAASKVCESGMDTYLNTYDTEMNIELTRLNEFSQSFDVFKGRDLHHEGVWSVTDRVAHIGDEYWEIFKDFIRNEKVKNKKNYTFETPYMDKDGNTLKTIFPSFGQIDSLTRFVTSDVVDIQNKNELGSSGGNTIHMRQGLSKARLWLELPGLCNSGSHYTIVVAHIGDATNIQQGPVNLPPPKKLQHMKANEKIKGVSDDFYYLTSQAWQTTSSKVFINDTTKGPYYPRKRDDVEEGSEDLNLVTVKCLRNKSGPSGFSIPIIISQREGVLASLTEFHYIKETAKYGIEGNNTTYHLVLYPNKNISRTTVRYEIDNDPLLRRAIKITSDLLQISQYYKELDLAVPDINDFYKKLEEKYGWDVLLRTRDYFTFNNYEHPVPFLSTMDMLEMYHDVKDPYWWKGKGKKVEK